MDEKEVVVEETLEVCVEEPKKEGFFSKSKRFVKDKVIPVGTKVFAAIGVVATAVTAAALMSKDEEEEEIITITTYTPENSNNEEDESSKENIED